MTPRKAVGRKPLARPLSPSARRLSSSLRASLFAPSAQETSRTQKPKDEDRPRRQR